MNLLRRTPSTRGFTLVELAIVLAVISLMLGGLWRLMNSGNTQLRDQSSADQQKQLIAAVQGYLNTSEGLAYVTNLASGGTALLPLPTVNGTSGCTPAITTPTTAGFCGYLPVGFYNLTTNSYGQFFSIRIRRDDSGKLAGTTPTAYSFMILTTNGNMISDTDGSRIASLLGNDGGFVYGTNTCAAAYTTTACGSYSAWSAITTTDYGFPTPTGTDYSGHIATRSIIGTGTLDVSNWLARKNITGSSIVTLADGQTSPDYNTMQTALYMGTATFDLAGSTLVGSLLPSTSTANRAKFGTINNINNAFFYSTYTTDKTQPTPGLTLQDVPGCTGVGAPALNDQSCDTLVVNGTERVRGTVVADTFYATSMIFKDTSAPSDLRLKHDIVPLKHALDNLGKIKGISYILNQDHEKKYGVVAQDVAKVYPQLVHDIGGGYLGVDYVGLIGPLVAAVNELREENKTLRAQTAEQAKAITALQHNAHAP